VFMIPPNTIFLYSMSRMTMLVLVLEPCNIFSAASCNKLMLSYKIA
jgi:hypothetical protein